MTAGASGGSTMGPSELAGKQPGDGPAAEPPECVPGNGQWRIVTVGYRGSGTSWLWNIVAVEHRGCGASWQRLFEGLSDTPQPPGSLAILVYNTRRCSHSPGYRQASWRYSWFGSRKICGRSTTHRWLLQRGLERCSACTSSNLSSCRQTTPTSDTGDFCGRALSSWTSVCDSWEAVCRSLRANCPGCFQSCISGSGFQRSGAMKRLGIASVTSGIAA